VSNHFETLRRELVGIKRLVLTELAAIKRLLFRHKNQRTRESMMNLWTS